MPCALPAGFVVLVARRVGAVPGAAEGGFASAAGRSVVGLLAGIAGVLLAREGAQATYEAARWDLYRRYGEYS